ncbi:transposase, partial [Streptomyces sp. NPDC003042]
MAHHDGLQPTQHEAVWSLPPQGDSEGPNLHLSHSTIFRSCPTTNSLSCSGHKTSKIHLACDGSGRPLASTLIGGNTNDCTQFTTVMDAIQVPRLGLGRPRTRPDHVIGDKGYSSKAILTWLRRPLARRRHPVREDRTVLPRSRHPRLAPDVGVTNGSATLRCNSETARTTPRPGFSAPRTDAGERRVRMVASRFLVPAREGDRMIT